jgi:hypothetical protein
MPIRVRECRGLGAPGISGADGERDVIKNLQPLLGRTKLLMKAALLDTKGGCNFCWFFHFYARGWSLFCSRDADTSHRIDYRCDELFISAWNYSETLEYIS